MPMATKTITGICQKCKHFSSCKVPCAFAEKILSDGNKRPMERPMGDDTTILFPKSRQELNEATLTRTYDEDGRETKATKAIFEDTTESPFSTDTLEPKNKQTAVFIDRFLHRKSYEEIAGERDTTPELAAFLFSKAKRRLLDVVAAMDRLDFARVSEKPLATMPKMVRCFLLHTLVGLTPVEVSDFLGVDLSLTHRNIKHARDLLLAGDLDLLDATDTDREAAMARISATKAKRSERDKKAHRKRKAAVANAGK